MKWNRSFILLASLLITSLYAEGPADNEFVAKSFGEVVKAAQAGNQVAMCELAHRCMQDTAPFENPNQTFEWLKQTASPDNPHAQYLLAWFYQHGTGVAKDKRKASELWRQITQKYKLAAEKGDPDAQYMFAQMYSWGFLDNGMPWDVVKAHEWLERAASAGHANAQFVLAEHYRAGSGMLKDPNFVEAYKWYTAAETRGHPAAKNALTKLAGEMTPAQIAEAKKRAEALTPKPAPPSP